MRFPVYIVDAFTAEPFKGNPAAVVLLEQEIPSQVMAAVAAEMNLSETAFLLPTAGGQHLLRWFTPRIEVSLCGHATIAAAKVLFSEQGYQGGEVEFHTLSGTLRAAKHDDYFALDFPLDAVREVRDVPKELLQALGLGCYTRAFQGQTTGKLVLHLEHEHLVRSLLPDFHLMARLNLPGVKGVGVTAAGDGDYDFVSRYFNPWAGVNEDPVTGSVHTALAAYWSEILIKQDLLAFQASARGGELKLIIKDEGRLDILGKAVVVLRGTISI